MEDFAFYFNLMPQALKKFEGHIALALSVRGRMNPPVSLSVYHFFLETFECSMPES